ncbi:hypothetical protein C8R47DRAFT_1071917 [Mycena vitilis]|nr:hypothetical protein C8R47DRAFT_1071917 [Mycena vitilis]
MFLSNISTLPTGSPQTAKALARMHTKVPDTNPTHGHQSMLSWLQPRKVPRPALGYRRVIQTSPPSVLPTLRSLSIGRTRSSPGTAYPSAAHPTDSHPSTDNAHSPGSARVALSTPTKKAHLYEYTRTASGPSRCATSHPSRPLTTREPVSSPTPASRVTRTPPSITATGAGSPGAKRRHGVPVFAEDMQVVLKDMLKSEGKEEQEEKLLTELLSGRVVGGKGMQNSLDLYIKRGPATPTQPRTSAKYVAAGVHDERSNAGRGRGENTTGVTTNVADASWARRPNELEAATGTDTAPHNSSAICALTNQG